MKLRPLPHARLWAVLSIATALTGCASLKSHDELATEMQTAGRTGGVAASLARLESTATTEDDKKALLYNLERGELLRMQGRYEDSNNAFLLADTKVKDWEEAAKTNPQKLMGTLGASLISERFKVYEGQDYEKVWLTTRLALNRMALGDFENARVDIKRTHEREAVIAEFRAKEMVAAEEEAKSKGASSASKEISGYPVETLNDPEVLALKNGYQNALSHYLAGFLYEAINEPGMAAPGYRKAIELKPETRVLEEGLRGLDSRTSFTWKRRQGMTDVLFVVEAGEAPARKPKAFTLPIPINHRINTVSISYPVIEPSRDPLLSQLSAAGYDFRLERVVDLNVMARRALKDEMPGMVLRGFTRALAKGVMQDQLQEKGGALAGLLGAIAAIATEKADDRMWRMLPGRVYVARGYLPPGKHRVRINGREVETEIDVGGQYALVPLRLHEQQILVGQVATIGALAAGAAPGPVPAPTSTAAPASPVQPPTKKTSLTTAPNRRTVVAPAEAAEPPPAHNVEPMAAPSRSSGRPPQRTRPYPSWPVGTPNMPAPLPSGQQ
ncbi:MULTISPECIES: COG3014 family protein [Giesbergeria]|uniref:COG3014 family protein n=1 Tax=Giesbergeria sinuosa TaxID=80883 RepID=A0ABV9QD08_9BURK